MNICVSVSFYCSCSSSQLLCLFYVSVHQFSASVLVLVFMLVFQD